MSQINKRPKSLSFKPPQPSTAITSTNVISFNNGHNTHNNISTNTRITSDSSSLSLSGTTSTTSTTTATTTHGIKQDYKKIKQRNEFKSKKELSINLGSIIDNQDHDNNESNRFRIEELNFLYSIYVPNKYLIKNNKKSIKNLINHLPKLINNSNQLNLSIHLFLSTIMIKFINSWYLNKLNTNNLEFLKNLYDGLLIELIKNLINKILKLNFLNLINQLIEILNQHIIEFNEFNFKFKFKLFPYKFQNNYFKSCHDENNLIFDENIKSIDELNIDYLLNSHILFQNDPVNYYRILIKQILKICFHENNQEQEVDDNINNPFSSKISSDLIILILGDLVMDKIVNKLSSSEFIFNKLNDILDLLLIESPQQQQQQQQEQEMEFKQEDESLTNKIKDWISGTYTNLTKLIVLYHGKIKITTSEIQQQQEEQEELIITSTNSFNIFECSIFSLIETLFNISKRKPILYNIIQSFKTLIQMNDKLSTFINKITTRYLENKIIENLTEERISKIINDLRIGLFYNQEEPKEEEGGVNIVTIDELIEKFIKLNKKLSLIIDISYKDEDENDIKNSIKSVLILFQDNGEYLNKGINKLLIIKLIDCIISNLYDNI